jgi:hypothetical protein
VQTAAVADSGSGIAGTGDAGNPACGNQKGEQRCNFLDCRDFLH